MDPNASRPDQPVPELMQPTETVISPTQSPSAPTPATNETAALPLPAADSAASEAVSVTVTPTLSPAAPSEAPAAPPPVVPGPVIGGAPVTNGASPVVADSSAPAPAPKSGKRWLKPLLIGLAVVVVLGGGSAAAYYGVVVPNKPANVLKAALENSFQQKQSSYSGTVEVDPAQTGSGVSYKATVKGAEDSTAKAADVQLNLTVSGVNFAVEARLVDQNLYLKVGDLDTLTSLLSGYSPSLASTAQTLSSELSNTWVEVDSTLLQESGASCALNTSWSLTPADVQLLEDQYGKDPFATIQSTSSDTVGGKKVEKFVLSLDDDKMATYAKSLGNVSLIKSLESCDKDSNPLDSLISADHDHTPLTIWVDKSSKQIVQVASSSTAQDAKSAGIKATATIGVSYGKVSITAPSGAKPALQVLGQIEQSLQSSGVDLDSLLGGLMGSTTPDSTFTE